MTSGEIALLISGGAVAIAVASFAWNILEKFIYVKPRLQVSFGIYSVLQGGRATKRLCNLSVTNMGPGSAILHSCIVKMSGPRFWKPQYGILNPIHGDPTNDAPISVGPFSGGLPATINSGEVKSFYFPFTSDTFLKEPLIGIGVTDTYGRKHWCRRQDLEKARLRYEEEFMTEGKDVGAKK